LWVSKDDDDDDDDDDTVAPSTQGKTFDVNATLYNIIFLSALLRGLAMTFASAFSCEASLSYLLSGYFHLPVSFSLMFQIFPH
jgi:hypothetical protein